MTPNVGVGRVWVQVYYHMQILHDIGQDTAVPAVLILHNNMQGCTYVMREKTTSNIYQSSVGCERDDLRLGLWKH